MLHNQINYNETYNTMHTNVLPFYTPLTPVWGQKLKHFFLKKVMVHITLLQLKMFDVIHTPGLLGWVKMSIELCR